MNWSVHHTTLVQQSCFYRSKIRLPFIHVQAMGQQTAMNVVTLMLMMLNRAVLRKQLLPRHNLLEAQNRSYLLHPHLQLQDQLQHLR